MLLPALFGTAWHSPPRLFSQRPLAMSQTPPPRRRRFRRCRLPSSGSKTYRRARARLGARAERAFAEAAAGAPRVRADRERLLEDPEREGPHPADHAARRPVYNLWQDETHKRGPVAAHDARRIPQAAAGLGDRARPRRARRGRARELGLGRRARARDRLRALLVFLSRGGADAQVVREFDTRREGLREGRLHAARGEDPRRLADATPCWSPPTSAPAR
jgi:prolyl oligopeptidase PreP (S9A serine peptidase family)